MSYGFSLAVAVLRSAERTTFVRRGVGALTVALRSAVARPPRVSAVARKARAGVVMRVAVRSAIGSGLCSAAPANRQTASAFRLVVPCIGALVPRRRCRRSDGGDELADVIG